jgi:hypothetical protein
MDASNGDGAKRRMAAVDFTDAELEALYAVYTNAERIDWSAYDQARQRIVDAGRKHLESRFQNRD